MNTNPRFFHVRAPLVIRQFIGNKEATPSVIPDLAGANGGCTISIVPHDDEYVAVRVGWCRYDESYNRKLGRIVCHGGKLTKKVFNKNSGVHEEKVIAEYPGKDPTLVKREDLEAELEAIEREMLLACAYPLRRDEELLQECIGDWSRAAARYYQKTNA